MNISSKFQMDDLKVRTCKLCLTAVNGENCETIDDVTKEIFDVLLLKLDFDTGIKYVMCNVCSSKVHAALNFKSTCFYTDDAITPYVDDAKYLPIDLKEIYIKEKKSEHLSDDIKICRLCMLPIESVSEFKSINEEHIAMLQKFVPEIEIFVIKEPVICKLCLDSLGMHCSFLKKCLDVEQNVGDIPNKQVPDAPSPVPSLDVSVKIENIDIKFEDLQQSNESKSADINDKGIKYQYSYEATQKGHLKIHSLLHKDSSQIQMYKCDTCGYQSKRKNDLRSHMLFHKNKSEVQTYQCKNCTFETKYKTSIKFHVLRHTYSSEMEMYKCNSCTYETRQKRYLVSHMLIHKDPSAVRMYRCENCTYETRHKKVLRTHIVLLHKDPSEVHIYKCDTCSYETRQKGLLKRHMIKHKDPSELPMYKCETCNYKGKHKQSLKQHMLTHKGPSERQMYKCDTCSYETRQKGYLKTHMLIHKDRSEVQMYGCEICSYETKRKPALKVHMLIHKDP